MLKTQYVVVQAQEDCAEFYQKFHFKQADGHDVDESTFDLVNKIFGKSELQPVSNMVLTVSK